MKRAQSEDLARRIMHYYENSEKKEVPDTCHHFEKEGYHYQTISRILNRCIKRNSTQLLERGGKRPTVATPEFLDDVRRIFEEKPDTSVRSAANKLHVAKSTLSDAKLGVGIHAFTKKKSPKYRDGQKERAQTNCGIILKRAHGRAIIMDDETYVPRDPADVPGRQFYHTSDRNRVKDEQRFKATAKFTEKWLIWQAVDCDGHVSRPYVHIGTMTKETYLIECLQKRLIPFIKKYHKKERILFWPDLASCHYA
jgi:hypothetical protein